jgi:hypothetical protein
LKLAIGVPGAAAIWDYDTPADYHAGKATIALCRAALDEIATVYDECVTHSIAYHRAALAAIEAAGLLPIVDATPPICLINAHD